MSEPFDTTARMERVSDSIAKQLSEAMKINARLTAERDAMKAALTRALRIVSDRAAGGRMLTSKEEAWGAFQQGHQALTSAVPDAIAPEHITPCATPAARDGSSGPNSGFDSRDGGHRREWETDEEYAKRMRAFVDNFNYDKRG